MIPKTSKEQQFYDNNGFSTEIKIYPRESRNYDISKETPLSEYDKYTLRTWGESLDTNNLNKPALCTLIPDSCKVTEELNGTLEATFTASFDKFKRYENVREYNYVRILNDLFYIYKVSYNTTSSGTKITAYCLHVTYQLKDLYCPNAIAHAVPPVQFTSVDTDVKDWLWLEYAHYLNFTRYISWDNKTPINFADKNYYHQKFQLNSDITQVLTDYMPSTENPLTLIPDDRSFLSLLIDDDQSFTSELGGEIYRYGFYLSINNKKEDAKINAFSLQIGYNLSGIKREIDYSKFCTDFRYAYTYPISEVKNDEIVTTVKRESIAVRAKNDFGCPTRIFKTYFEEYDENPGAMALYYAERYFLKNYGLKVKYTITASDATDNPDFSGFEEIDYRVGDTGYINDAYFGSVIKAKITKTVKDGKTGKLISAEFDCESDYEAQPNGIQHLDPDFIQKVSAEYMLWEDVAKYKWYDISQKTWGSLKGE